MYRLSGIKNKDQRKLYDELSLNEMLDDNFLVQNFIKNFKKWIKKSTYNSLIGLDIFNDVKITNGSIQIFDFFYMKHKNRRFRFFHNEFMYHNAVLKNNFNYKFYDDTIASEDAFLMSVPFTRTGYKHNDFQKVLEQCENKNVPVLLDFCHLPCSKNIVYDLNSFNCVETLSFSLSKFFHNAEYMRIGIRFQKDEDFIDDGIDVFNSVGIDMINRICVGIANKIIEKYPMDFLWNTYGKVYEQICKDHNLIPTDNIIIAINEKNERICVSDLIYEKYESSKKSV